MISSRGCFVFFRVFNFLWIIFAIVFIELTLNLNHVNAVTITDNSNAGIFTPAQLLPMLIGIFSFIRMLYLAFEHFRASDGDIRPSLGVKPSFKPGYIKEKPTGWYSRVKWRLKFFSVALAKDHDKDESEKRKSCNDKELERLETIRRKWSVPRQWLITWLPWLSLISFWPWKNGIEQLQVEGFANDDVTPILEYPESNGSAQRKLVDAT